MWATAGVTVLGFLGALEIAAHRYGMHGPVTGLAREAVLPPKSGFALYAGLALTMVVLTRRQRLVAAAAAAGVDVVLFLVRWAAGADLSDGHPFGSGALWVMLGCAAVAVRRRTGPDRALMLKGVGLGLLLVAGRKTGDTWLLITAKTRPTVLDPYVATADHALGSPSWLMGRLLTASGTIGAHALNYVYAQLAVAAVVVALYQLRHVAAERRFPRHHLVRTFLVIGMLGPAVYMIFPVVGPLYAYGAGNEHWASAQLWPPSPPTLPWAVADLWPDVPTPVGSPHPIPFDGITPRNCMPSLHTAWATAIFIHSRRAPRVLRWAGTFWLIATLCATLGFGYHYGADLVAGVVFTVTIEAALRAHDRGWDRPGLRLVASGTAVFAALLASYRFLPVPMAEHPWVAGPLLLLAMASVIVGYVRTTARWDRRSAPDPNPPNPDRDPNPDPPNRDRDPNPDPPNQDPNPDPDPGPGPDATPDAEPQPEPV
ncbi:phosphatase PAP2 family protein [Streptomyces sp. NPDC053367]|uniref:phosphatase PAP2 family protein n=1 Tax=Streptomyces sp. NPDC053367 TaxID=3365700 RepID=UPI0037D740FF